MLALRPRSWTRCRRYSSTSTSRGEATAGSSARTTRCSIKSSSSLAMLAIVAGGRCPPVRRASRNSSALARVRSPAPSPSPASQPLSWPINRRCCLTVVGLWPSATNFRLYPSANGASGPPPLVHEFVPITPPSARSTLLPRQKDARYITQTPGCSTPELCRYRLSKTSPISLSRKRSPHQLRALSG